MEQHPFFNMPPPQSVGAQLKRKFTRTASLRAGADHTAACRSASALRPRGPALEKTGPAGFPEVHFRAWRGRGSRPPIDDFSHQRAVVWFRSPVPYMAGGASERFRFRAGASPTPPVRTIYIWVRGIPCTCGSLLPAPALATIWFARHASSSRFSLSRLVRPSPPVRIRQSARSRPAAHRRTCGHHLVDADGQPTGRWLRSPPSNSRATADIWSSSAGPRAAWAKRRSPDPEGVSPDLPGLLRRIPEVR